MTITNYAQSSLGDVVFVELPVVGTEVKQGGEYVVKARRAVLTCVSQTRLVLWRA